MFRRVDGAGSKLSIIAGFERRNWIAAVLQDECTEKGSQFRMERVEVADGAPDHEGFAPIAGGIADVRDLKAGAFLYS